MAIESLLLQIIVVPLIFAPIAFIMSRWLNWRTGWVAFIPLAFTSLATIYLTSYVAEHGAVLGVWPLAPSAGLNFTLLVDGLSAPIALTVAILCTVVSIYSMPYMEHKIGKDGKGHGAYYALYLLYAAGMLGTALSANLIQFYFFWELMLIPSWAMINIWGYGEREKIAFKYFIYTHIGALSLLAGILATYAAFGTFDLLAILSLSKSSVLSFELVKWIIFAMFLGFAVKMAIVPLHTWLPDAHAEAPTPISALLSPAMIGLGGYALVRLTYLIFPQVFEQFATAFSVLALITMIYGGVMALAQDDIKRLLAYSSISQMGYLLFGIASSYPQGIAGSMFHYVSHGTCKAILFMMAGAIILQTHGLRSISKLGGLAGKMPLTAICALIGFLGIAGTPPLNGFQSEWLIFTGAFAGAMESGNMIGVIITALALIGSVLTAGYALWAIRRIFFGPLPEHLNDVHEAPLTVTIPMFILAFITVLLGIYPKPITDLLSLIFS
ncbi:MAG: formate hydrogenlyase [Candidatus Methanomethylicota archaeon]|uniref:Formate hydrogenlyase n=2 Tax=Thermoproteota archaeon TaxID=2056631 RepID=A0A497F383_9CREN|nr:MAG: formate hydrogenlyase [Candidatus Verstraetearchaeota archaeon]